ISALEKARLFPNANTERFKEKSNGFDANLDIIHGLSDSYHALGNYPKVIETLEEARANGLEDRIVYENLQSAYGKLGMQDKFIEICEVAVVKGLAGPNTYNRLGNAYIKRGDVEQGVKLWQSAIELGKADSIILWNLFSTTNDKSYIGMIMDKVRDPTNRDYESYAIMARYAASGGGTYSPSTFYKRLVAQLINNVDFYDLLEDHAFATSRIKIIKGLGELPNSLIVKQADPHKVEKRGDRLVDPYRIECIRRDQLEEVIGSLVELPQPVESMEYLLEEGGEVMSSFYYIMERKRGDVLSDLVREGRVPSNIAEKIVESMAKVHVEMSIWYTNQQDDVKTIIYPIHGKIASRAIALAKEARLGLAEVTRSINTILDNIGFPLDLQKGGYYNQEDVIFAYLKNKSQSKLCYNFDSSTENWMVGKNGELIRIDTEDKGCVNYVLDLAAFLNFLPFLPMDKRISAVELYIDRVNEFSHKYGDHSGRGIKDRNQFMNEYSHASLYRSITGAAYLLARPGRADDSAMLRTAGLETLDFMQGNGFIPKDLKSDYNVIRKLLSF
ncbi:MAG: hypothetical protein ABIJ08_06145, partial [Nanoarchaeota archaeon]